ncbi:carbon-nitrogen hydrolase family protein [Kineococcus rhizosphaerae]|uniref:Putative amidohydrolase n=1 Tax=Kineococcus rhizosphaerae TaxID=559628 RepID=A0A2T0QY55_9ACTN|nr:carbon-nitrogen hydrolase family protein [Kineococcus rhizosphaerae]PRY11152.1 putative amidohydrolase [Kineococcus rhizosphaerae]
MTVDKNLKRLVRARAAQTGQPYTAALQHFRADRRAPLRVAVAQLPVGQDPTDPAVLRRGGELVRDRMRRAAQQGARLLHLPEGATCFPDKRVLSSTGPDEIGPSDWDRFAWDVLRDELETTARLAAELRLWTVFGSTHRLSAGNRPHNCLYVLDHRGRVRTRYDERYLSHTKATWMYSPGRAPVVVAVDGWRFGLALGLESHFPEVFAEYERLDVDGVLFSSTGNADHHAAAFAVECAGHAATNGLWVSFAVPPQQDPAAAAGFVAPGGRWLERCSPGRDVVVLDLVAGGSDVETDVDVAVTKARPWRRRVRESGHGELVDDVRSRERAGF